jgi:1-acyl-sn-glycerol-3-phosphate acyltransferase
VYFGIVFFVIFLVTYPFFFILLSRDEWVIYAFKLKKVWSFLMSVFALVPVVVKKEVELPKDTPYVICANHTSYLDIVLMNCIISNFFVFMGKAELLKWPIVNVFFRNGRMDIAVNRTNKREAMRALQKAGEALELGRSVMIFPEGTMPETAPKMKRFKNGAFKLAIENQVPIVPLTLITNWKLFSDHTDIFGRGRPGICRAKIHKPISTKGMTDKDLVSLREQTFNTINQELKNHGVPA